MANNTAHCSPSQLLLDSHCCRAQCKGLQYISFDNIVLNKTRSMMSRHDKTSRKCHGMSTPMSCMHQSGQTTPGEVPEVPVAMHVGHQLQEHHTGDNNQDESRNHRDC